MGLEMELDSDKSSTVGLSPNTVLPPPRHCSNIEKRNTRGKYIRRDELLRVPEGFTEISFHHYRSSSCKNIPSGPVGLVALEGNTELRRDSIYQNSNQVRKMKKMGAIGGRKKIELSLSSGTSFSFKGVNPICSSDEDSSQNGTSVMSGNSNSNMSSDCKPFVELCPSDEFIEFTLNSDCREKAYAEALRRDALDNLNFRCLEVVGPLNDGNNLFERDAVLTFQKSHSAKVEMTYSPSQLESDLSSRASSKAYFGPIRNMFDPFMKSTSLQSPLGYDEQPKSVKTIRMENTRRERAIRKSLLHDFSHKDQNSESNSKFVNKDQHHSVVAHSPVHLHGLLKLEHQQGVPYFEFSLHCPKDVILAQTWKADSAFNWLYTFHSVDGRKKSNVSGWGSSNRKKECSVVGQMQVSCYLWSELKDGSVFDNSLVTEFVLYDVAHTSQSVTAQELLKCSSNATPPNPGFVKGKHELDNGSDSVKFKEEAKYASNKSNPCPWASGDLHPNLEIAAIVIQAPFERRESLKYKRGNNISDNMHSNLLNFSMVEKRGKDHLESKRSEEVKVVIPNGNHSSPNAESRGPSSLLDRWRLGGGCDCGGWDMGCPLTVFSSPNIKCAEHKPLVDNKQPVELFVQGAKVNTPALTIICLEEGQYAVDFHAQLSTLQAFSICIAILHGSEASIAAGQERGMQVPHCNSLKMLMEEEVKFLIDAVTEEEKKKFTKKAENIPQSYMINPPFSPIARV